MCLSLPVLLESRDPLSPYILGISLIRGRVLTKEVTGGISRVKTTRWERLF